MDLLSTISPEMAEMFNEGTALAINSTSAPNMRSAHSNSKLLIKVVYIVGIIGNAIAIVAIRTGKRRVRNRKHMFLLTTLAVNDLVALVGMLCSMLAAEMVPGTSRTQAYCATRVALRVFGIGSVCITVVMALERYMAVTRPFLYQKQVTHNMIRSAVLVAWLAAATLTCAPVLGWGVYYNGQKSECVRYRDAETTNDFVYAIVYVNVGTLLCVILVYCNMAVIRALYAMSAPSEGATVVRRVSKNSCRQRERTLNSNGSSVQPIHNVATAEEVFFSRLMAALSVFFMICWLPQMVTSILFLSLERKANEWLVTLSFLSDLMMLLNYVLNPVLYVLMRRLRLSQIYRPLAQCFKWQNHKSSTESIKTSCCPQETLLVSEHSVVAETRLLKPVPTAPAPQPVNLQRR